MRVTGPLLKVLSVMQEDPGTAMYGLQLSRSTGLKSGTLYPLLDRLEEVGWVESRWETPDPTARRHPRRRYYSLTGTGVHEARHILAEYGMAGGLRWT